MDYQQPSLIKKEGSQTNSTSYDNPSLIEGNMKTLHNRINRRGRDLIIACSLGDGCISKQGQLMFNHSWKQYEYALWKYNLLRHNGVKMGNFRRKECTNGYLSNTIQYRYNGNVTMFNKVLRRVMYKDGKKQYKRKLLNRLTPQGLAIWFMDDGTILRRKYKGQYKGFYLRISTYCSSDQADVIIKYFNEEYNIHPTKVCEHSKGDLYTINFGAKEGKKLIDIIKPYMCPAMMYKVLYDVEELKKYYDVQEVSEILTKCTLESDRLLMEARNNSEKN